MTWQIECSRHNPPGRIGLRFMLRHSSSAGISPPSHSLPEPKTNGVAGDVSFLSASNPHFSQDCRPDRANPIPAGTSFAISDVVGSHAVILSKAGLRCSGNDLRPAVRPTLRNPG